MFFKSEEIDDMEIKCLIFDCDGLMFDTEHHVSIMWKRVSEKHGLELPENFFGMIFGSGPETLTKVKEEYPEHMALSPEISENILPFIRESIEKNGNINKKGLVELLQYLNEVKKYKVCIASSSPTDYLYWLVSTIGYDFDFDVILGGDKVKNRKPDPEIFLKAAEIVGVNPENCLVLEDSKNGHKAALAAGMHRMFIEDIVARDDEMKCYIEFQRDNLSEVIDFLKTLD